MKISDNDFEAEGKFEGKSAYLISLGITKYPPAGKVHREYYINGFKVCKCISKKDAQFCRECKKLRRKIRTIIAKIITI